jgi:hypothetical protein
LNTQIDFYTENYGSTGWFGFTFYFNANGADNSGGYPTKNYTFCTIKLNTYTGFTPMKNTWTGITTHEIGHAFGLSHYSGSSSLMNADIAYMNTPTAITSDEISGIRSLYQ